MEKISLMLRESYDELLQHVTWPTLAELTESAVVVLVASLFISFITFGMDAITRVVLDLFYGL